MVKHTSVIPGEGLGTSIKLGQTFYYLVNQLIRYDYKINITYSEKCLRTPILVTLPDIGIRLMFTNSHTQELLLIEVLNFEKIQLFYKGSCLNNRKKIPLEEQSYHEDRLEDEINDEGNLNLPNSELKFGKAIVPPNLNLIYNQLFGITFPGKLLPEGDVYILSYPGILFKFKILLKPLVNSLKNLNDKDENTIISKLLNWENCEDIVCELLAISPQACWNNFCNNLRHTVLKDVPVKTKRKEPYRPYWNLDKVVVNLKLGKLKLEVSGNSAGNPKHHIITIGESSQQEILNILGPPDDYFNKYNSRVDIHNQANISNESTLGLSEDSIFKFHNYFRFGLDFLYDLNYSGGSSTGVLSKVVIHNGGIVESLDFMRWNKCNFVILTGQDTSQNDIFISTQKMVVDSSMCFGEIPPPFFKSIGDYGKLKPVLLNRNRSNMIDDDLEVINIDDYNKNEKQHLLQEHTEEKSSLNGSNQKMKTWGQSRLYGCKSCIWEVVDNNDCISSITIY